MLLWGLAGFVNPEKSGKVFEQALGLTVTDEFFKDNAIEVLLSKQLYISCSELIFEFYPEWRNVDVLGGHGLLLFPSEHLIIISNLTSRCKD